MKWGLNFMKTCDVILRVPLVSISCGSCVTLLLTSVVMVTVMIYFAVLAFLLMTLASVLDKFG